LEQARDLLEVGELFFGTEDDVCQCLAGDVGVMPIQGERWGYAESAIRCTLPQAAPPPGAPITC
jgi:hypothetical protein